MTQSLLRDVRTVFRHLDYDGTTSFANFKDGELRHLLQNHDENKAVA